MVDGQRTDNGPWLYYKLTNEPKGSGKLKIALPSDFKHIFFMILYMYIALGQGQTTH